MEYRRDQSSVLYYSLSTCLGQIFQKDHIHCLADNSQIYFSFDSIKTQKLSSEVQTLHLIKILTLRVLVFNH